MIAMKFTIELDIGLSFLLQAALPQLVTDRETKTHRRERSKRSYGHCRRRTEIPEAERRLGRPTDVAGSRADARSGLSVARLIRSLRGAHRGSNTDAPEEALPHEFPE